MTEGPDLELAAELCDFYAGRAAEVDRSLFVSRWVSVTVGSPGLSPSALRVEGRRIYLDAGTGGSSRPVYLTPIARRSALRVIAEGPDLELAAELCDFYAGRAAEVDRSISEHCVQEKDK